MNNPLEIPSTMIHNIHLYQLVQQLIDNYQLENDHVSHELYENIAQSLVAIKTQLVLMEKKLSSQSPEFTNNIQNMDSILQSTLRQIRALADGLYSNKLVSLGLEATIKDLCTNYRSLMNRRVSFENNLTGYVPPWIGRQHALCLYYFTDQALTYACSRSDSPISVLLEWYPEQRISISVRFSQRNQPENSERNTILPILQEWLYVWGGNVTFAMLPDSVVSLTAWMDENASALGEVLRAETGK
jgi:signal transduction histidine kinase